EEASERARVTRETERALYGALDRRDPAHQTEAGEQLASDDPAVRLAALRYLAGVDATGHAEALLAALDDPAPRVRTAALSLVARSLPLARCGDALVRVARDEARPLAERQLALSGLGAARQV